MMKTAILLSLIAIFCLLQHPADGKASHRHRRHQGEEEEAAVDEPEVEFVDLDFDFVDARLYTRVGAAASDGSLVYLHGGGWQQVDRDSLHDYVVGWVQKTSMPIVAVYFPVAPDNRFPVPYQESLRAVKYFISHAEDWGIDSTKIILYGDDSGANLVAAVCLGLRDAGFEPRPAAQILLYPYLQAIDFLAPSWQGADQDMRDDKIRNAVQYGLGTVVDYVQTVYQAALDNQHTSPEVKQQMASTSLNHASIPASTYPSNYALPSNSTGNSNIWNRISYVFLNPYFMPLMARNLSGLPETYIVVAANDLLLDDALWYKQGLEAAGTPVTLEMIADGIHGMLSPQHIAEYPHVWQQVLDYIGIKFPATTADSSGAWRPCHDVTLLAALTSGLQLLTRA